MTNRWAIILGLALLLSSIFVWRINGKIKIAVQPFAEVDSQIIDSLSINLTRQYGATIQVLNRIELPEKAYYKPRNRYRADSLIAYLKQYKTHDFDYIIGVTKKDISTSKGQYIDWGVFGLGYRPGPSCIISTHRLKHNDKALFIERIEKVALHEIGHNLGLPHCNDNNLCVMNDAHGTIKEVDDNNHGVCGACKIKLFCKKMF